MKFPSERLLLFDDCILRPDGHIHYWVELACKDEAGAREQAKARVDGFDVELWELGKMIERFKGKWSPD